MSIKGGKRDRDKLRKRVKAALGELDTTQKDFEDANGLSSGTLTRLFAGRRGMDAELLESLASGLDTPAAELVSGTTWTELLEESAPEPEPEPEVAAEPEPEPEKPTEPEPKAAKSEPKAAKPEPKAAKSEPKAAKPEPKAAKPEPKAAKSEPKAAEPASEAPKSAPPPKSPPPKGGSGTKTRFFPLRVLRFIKSLVLGD